MVYLIVELMANRSRFVYEIFDDEFEAQEKAAEMRYNRERNGYVAANIRVESWVVTKKVK